MNNIIYLPPDVISGQSSKLKAEREPLANFPRQHGRLAGTFNQGPRKISQRKKGHPDNGHVFGMRVRDRSAHDFRTISSLIRSGWIRF